MANKYTYLFNTSHNNFAHVDITILRDDVPIAGRRVYVEPVESKEEDVIEFATDLLRSLRIQRDEGLITNQQAQTEFEAFEFWR
jgi:hypothetical protein